MEIPYGRGGEFAGGRSHNRTGLGGASRCELAFFLAPEEKWYRTGAIETGVRQFLVQDPDGYLIRFSAWVGERPISAPDGL